MTNGRGDEKKSEIQKFEWLENKKNSSVDEVKGIFQNNLKVIICWIKVNRRHKLEVILEFYKIAL